MYVGAFDVKNRIKETLNLEPLELRGCYNGITEWEYTKGDSGLTRISLVSFIISVLRSEVMICFYNQKYARTRDLSDFFQTSRCQDRQALL